MIRLWQAFFADADSGNVAPLCDALRKVVKYDLPTEARALLAEYITQPGRIRQRGPGRPQSDRGGLYTSWQDALAAADRACVAPLARLLRSDMEITVEARRALADYCEARPIRANGRPRIHDAARIYGAYRVFLTAHPGASLHHVYAQVAHHLRCDVATVREAVAVQQRQQSMRLPATPWLPDHSAAAHTDGDVPLDPRDDKSIRKRPLRRKSRSWP